MQIHWCFHLPHGDSNGGFIIWDARHVLHVYWDVDEKFCSYGCCVALNPDACSFVHICPWKLSMHPVVFHWLFTVNILILSCSCFFLFVMSRFFFFLLFFHNLYHIVCRVLLIQYFHNNVDMKQENSAGNVISPNITVLIPARKKYAYANA